MCRWYTSAKADIFKIKSWAFENQMEIDWLTALRHISTERLTGRPSDTSVQKATIDNENLDAV